MTPLSQVRLTPKKWGLYKRSVEKKQIFGAKTCQHKIVNTKLLSFRCPVITDIEEHQPSFENITHVDVDLI